ncbi:MAG: hypothetical protein HC888_00845 [Candidatus Competibacteraceae bacterium]|nr:hypothetical protein [Candidatus Competibacteraceae bacterium]
MYTHIMAAEDGRIYFTYSSAQATILVEGVEVDPFIHWYDWGERVVKEKGNMPIEISPTAITGVPCQCTVSVEGAVMHTFPLPAGDTPVLFDVVGTYEITITPNDPRWLPYRATLEVQG